MNNQWDYEIKQGETLRESFWLKQEDTKEPVNITGATAVCQVRKSSKAAAVLASPAITIQDAAAGQLQVYCAADIIAALPTTGAGFDQPDVWFWDAFITYANGDTECLWDGEFRVRPRVTA